MADTNTHDNRYGCSMTGVRRAAAFNSDGVIVFHSPKACGQVLREKDSLSLNQGVFDDSKSAPIISTNISDSEAVFGAEEKLEECLRYAIEKYRPSYVVAANSCVAGIIGDDILNISRKVQKELNIPIFVSTSAGFMDGYEQGLLSVSEQFIDFYMSPLQEKLPEVTIIGIIDKNRNYEYFFIKEVLASWGLTINCLFPGEATVQEMKKVGASLACILVGKYNKVIPPFRKLAGIIKEKVNPRVIELDDPIGYEKALVWVKEAGRALNIENDSIKATHDRLKASFIKVFQKYKQYLGGKSAALCLEEASQLFYDLEWFWEVLAELEIELKGIIFSPEIEEKEIINFLLAQKIGREKAVKMPSSHERYPADYIFAFRAGAADDDIIPLPYINPIFGAEALEAFLEKILKVEMKRRHCR